MTDLVPVDLGYVDARYGLILDSRVYQQCVTDASPLLVELLLSRILSSARLNGFLYSVEITQEIRSGDRREI